MQRRFALFSELVRRRIHHAKDVKEYALENSINLKYNPPYSPEFNPIELAFNKVKSEFRKLKHDSLLDDIKESFKTITKDNCISFYNKTKEFINKYQ
jgi:transposase